MSNVTSTFRTQGSLLESGTRYFKKALDTTQPGVEKTLISDTVAVGNQINILQCDVSCRHEGLIKIYVAGAVVGSKRTGPGNVNETFFFNPYHEASAGDTIEVKFEAAAFRPVTDVEAYIQGREIAV